MRKRFVAIVAAVAVLGACSKTGGGDYQGGSEGVSGDTTGMNGGATSGSNSVQQSEPGSAPAPAGTTGMPPQGAPGAAAGVPPVRAPTSGPSDISTPSGGGTPAHLGGTRDTTGKRP